jgi:hypothetical protein
VRGRWAATDGRCTFACCAFRTHKAGRRRAATSGWMVWLSFSCNADGRGLAAASQPAQTRQKDVTQKSGTYPLPARVRARVSARGIKPRKRPYATSMRNVHSAWFWRPVTNVAVGFNIWAGRVFAASRENRRTGLGPLVPRPFGRRRPAGTRVHCNMHHTHTHTHTDIHTFVHAGRMTRRGFGNGPRTNGAWTGLGTDDHLGTTRMGHDCFIKHSFWTGASR